jgi:hypothetical protein
MNMALCARWVALALLAGLLGGCGPVVRTTWRDYTTLRSEDGRALTGRDVAAVPMPREAIRSDDYFGIKLETIYLGPDDRQGVRNLGFIAEIRGIVPQGFSCDELPPSELDISLPERTSSNALKSSGCAFRTIVDLKTSFAGSHIAYDSTFITPVFRTANEPLNLRFLMVRIRDVSLAQRIVSWAGERLEGVMGRLAGSITPVARELVSVGVSAVNLLLDLAAEPTQVFEMTTDFVAAESVQDSMVPQNLLMAGDFVILGAQRGAALLSAEVAREQLQVNSGRLYWRRDGSEYRDAPYMIFKVVRFSRFPGALPFSLEGIGRQVRQGAEPGGLVAEAQRTLLALQQMHLLNETEGDMLYRLLTWYADTVALAARLESHGYGADDLPSTWREAPAAWVEGLAPTRDLTATAAAMRTLEERLYGSYGATPGFRQAECVAIRSLTQTLADRYATRRAEVVQARDQLQLRRVRLGRQASRSSSEETEYRALFAVEPDVLAQVNALPDLLPEPACPALREEPPGR